MSKKITTATIRTMKGKAKIAALTAYDFITAKLMDEVGIHVILVGDSVGTTVLGHKSTIPVTMDDMLHHLKAVSRAQPNALIVGDLATAEQTLRELNADPVWGRVVLYEPDGRRPILDASPARLPKSEAPWLVRRILRLARAEHRTQIALDGPFMSMPEDLARELWGSEYFTLLAARVPLPPREGHEDDLFAGIR